MKTLFSKTLFSLALAAFAATAAAAPAKILGNPNAPKGGIFYYNIQGEPTTLNPITSTDLYSRNVQGYVLDGLMERNPDTYEWEPALAEKVEKAADGKSFTFTLRKGVTFHDGKPLTVEDVKFSFDVIFDPAFNAAHLRPYYENIEKAEIVDPQTIRFTTKNKYFGNFDVIAGLTVIPKHFYGDAGGAKKNKTIVGTGPYKLDKYEQGQNIQLVRNDKWWGNGIEAHKGRLNFDKIFMRFVKDENSALEFLKKGQLDYETLTPEAYQLKAKGPEWGTSVIKVKTENVQPKPYGFIGWNMRKELFKDKNVRLALAHLVDRDQMNKKFRFDMSLKATGPWYQQSEYADPSIKAIEFNPKKAQELFKSAGWTDSDKDGVLDKQIDGKKQNFEFTLGYANKDNEKYWTLYQGDLAKAGVKMNLKYFEWNAFVKILDDFTFDAITMGWSGGSVDLDPKQIWHSSSAVKGGSNFVGYTNPEVDKLIEQGREELDKKKRIPIFRQVYKKIAEDAPYVFMFNDKYVLYAHTKRMQMAKPTFKYDIGRDYWWIQPNLQK